MSAFIQDLKQRLQNPLPGIEAQMQMISHKLAMPAGAASRFKVPEKHKKASVMALLYQKDGLWYTALMQRPESPYAHSRQVSFPGGGAEEQDLDEAHTALRETEEEFGIPQDSIEVLGQLTFVYIPVSNYLVNPFIGYLPTVPVFIPDHNEVEEVVEVPLQQILDRNNRKSKEIETHGGVVLPEVPYFHLNDKVVWGATAMMLSELATILDELAEQHALK